MWEARCSSGLGASPGIPSSLPPSPARLRGGTAPGPQDDMPIPWGRLQLSGSKPGPSLQPGRPDRACALPRGPLMHTPSSQSPALSQPVPAGDSFNPPSTKCTPSSHSERRASFQDGRCIVPASTWVTALSLTRKSRGRRSLRGGTFQLCGWYVKERETTCLGMECFKDFMY